MTEPEPSTGRCVGAGPSGSRPWRLVLQALGAEASRVVVAESEHCAADGIQALTGAATGNRDLIVKDWGKLAYTFYRKSDGKAVRMAWVAGLDPAYNSRPSTRPKGTGRTTGHSPLIRSGKGLSAVSHRAYRVHAGGVLDSKNLETTAVDLANASDVFAALADPARLRVLAVLADGPRCVCDIQAAVPIAANVLSYHLRVLREVGLLEGTRRGRWIDYRRTDGAARLVAGALHAAAFPVDSP